MMKALVQPRYVGVALAVALLLACFPTSAEAKMVGSLASRSQQLTPRQAREAEVARLLSEKKVAGKGGAYFLIGNAVVLLAILIYMTVAAA